MKRPKTRDVVVDADAWVGFETRNPARADENHGADTRLYIVWGEFFGGTVFEYARAYFSIKPENEPAGWATRSLVLSNISHNSNKIFLGPAADYWEEDVITWNNQPSFTSVTSSGSGDINDKLILPVTGIDLEKGFLLWTQISVTLETGWSREYSVPELRPIIRYTF